MKNKETAITPTSLPERIQSIDVLRGAAVLGILLLNIQAYAMSASAYLNPTAYGDLSGINKWTWLLSHILADRKFITIFSLLFGAGIVLMSQRTEAKGAAAAGLHYRRMAWLIVFGLLHAYLLWYGDILVCYGLCGLLVFPFRKQPAKGLLFTGLLVFTIPFWYSIVNGLELSSLPARAYEWLQGAWKPPEAVIQREIAAYRGDWWSQMSFRAPAALYLETRYFITHLLWSCGGLMLIGMALFKQGILSLKQPRRYYILLTTGGLGLGLPLVIYGVERNFAAGWSLDYSMYFGMQYNYFGSLFIALGYTGAVMLICQDRSLRRLTRPLAAVGRMAFTNYLLQTLICTSIFYGHGFGLFGGLERHRQIQLVLIIWLFQLIASPLWLKYFRYGPLEWLWRRLSYGGSPKNFYKNKQMIDNR
jgi:uncharacterized protein